MVRLKGFFLGDPCLDIGHSGIPWVFEAYISWPSRQDSVLKLKHSRGGFLCGLQSQADALIVALGDAYYKFWTFLENCIEALAFAFLWRGLCMCLKFPAE